MTNNYTWHQNADIKRDRLPSIITKGTGIIKFLFNLNLKTKCPSICGRAVYKLYNERFSPMEAICGILILEVHSGFPVHNNCQR